jgi:predicted ATPase
VVRPEFRPGPREAAQIVALCRLLDGDPLAIELAAGSAAEWGLGRLLARHSAARLRRSVREAGSVHDRREPTEQFHGATVAETGTDDEAAADDGSDHVLREPAV